MFWFSFTIVYFFWKEIWNFHFCSFERDKVNKAEFFFFFFVKEKNWKFLLRKIKSDESESMLSLFPPFFHFFLEIKIFRLSFGDWSINWSNLFAIQMSLEFGEKGNGQCFLLGWLTLTPRILRRSARWWMKSRNGWTRRWTRSRNALSTWNP